MIAVLHLAPRTMLKKIGFGSIGLLFLFIPVFGLAQDEGATNAGSCPNLTRNLAFGMRGNDVLQLQQFFVTQGLLALDSATGFFGVLTERAVKQFQCTYMNICSGSPGSTGYGAVRSQTRAAIAQICNNSSTTQASALHEDMATSASGSASTQNDNGSGTINGSRAKDVRVLGIYVNFQNAPIDQSFITGTPLTLPFKELLFGSGNSVKTFVEKNSYGTVLVSGDVAGPFTIPTAFSSTGSCDTVAWMDAAQSAAEQRGIALSSYSHIIFLFPPDPVVTKVCWMQGLAAYEPAKPYKRVIAFAPDAALHELLHQLGVGKEILGHAAGVGCGSGSVLEANYPSTCFDWDISTARWRLLEYGDPFDSLGITGGDSLGTVGFASTFNAPHRIAAGWLLPERVQAVSLGGTYTINSLDSSAGIVALKIKKPDSDPAYVWTKDDYYYVEYNPVTLYGQTIRVSGVTVRIWSGDRWRQSFFLDVTPGSCSPSPLDPNSCKLPNDFHDGFLQDGKIFTDNNNIRITQVSHTETTATVKIDFPGTSAPCSLGGVTVPSGQSQTFYSSQSVVSTSTCSTVAQTRTCTNGSLSGSSAYQYAACTVSGPTSSSNLISSCQAITTPGSYVLTKDIAQESGPCINIQNTSNVTLDCNTHTITNSSTGAIYMYSVHGFTIKRCVLNSEKSSGLTIYNSDSGTVSGNTVRAPGITVVSSTGLTISGNTISSQYAQNGTTNSTISNNTFANSTNYPGYTPMIVSSGGSNNKILNNTIDGGSDGVYSNKLGSDDGILLGDASGEESNDTVNGNTISNVWDCGIETSGIITGTIFDNNSITNAGYCGIGGWYGNSLSGNTVRNNTVKNAPTLLNFFYDPNLGGPKSNTVYFKDNTFTNNKLVNQKMAFSAYSGVLDISVGSSGKQTVFSNTVLQGNDFGIALPLRLNPFSMIVDGGANICNSGGVTGFPLNCDGTTSAQSCTLDSVTVRSGSSRTFFSFQSVPYLSSCSQVAQSRTCTNGTLSGDPSYKYASCVSAPAPSNSTDSITCVPTVVNPGALIAGTVTTSSQNIGDWVSIFKAGAANSDYTSSGANPSYIYVPLPRPATIAFTAPTTPGSYEMRFLPNNGYTSTASCTFTVSGATSDANLVNLANALTALEGALQKLLELLR